MNFLPDTNIIINYLYGLNPDREFLEEILNTGSLFVSPISIAEFLSKAATKDQEKFKEFLALGKVVAIDREIGFTAGAYRQEFFRKTKKVYLQDCFLAATCKAHNLVLITNNLKDYPMKDIKIVKP